MAHQIPKLKCSRLVLQSFFAQSIEARYWAENEDKVGAAQTGDTPITFEYSTILLPIKVRLTLEVWRYASENLFFIWVR